MLGVTSFVLDGSSLSLSDRWKTLVNGDEALNFLNVCAANMDLCTLSTSESPANSSVSNMTLYFPTKFFMMSRAAITAGVLYGLHSTMHICWCVWPQTVSGTVGDRRSRLGLSFCTSCRSPRDLLDSTVPS